MKHCFLVHSSITFLVSKQYVLDKGINPNDCLFLCARNYELSSEYQQKFKNVTHYPQDIFGREKEDLSLLKNLFNGFKGLHIIEVFISSFCQGNKFTLYTYSTYSHLCCILVTMSNCEGYYLIEEGSSAYSDISLVKKSIGRLNLFVQSILAPFFPRFYVIKDHHFSTSSDKYIGTITTSQKALNQLGGEKVIITNPFDKKKLEYSPTAVISIDASLYICGVESEYIGTIMESLYQFIIHKNEHPVIAYKFHPILIEAKVEKTFKDIISEVFKNTVLMELQADTTIEEILNQYQCDFYSDWSSVAIYAKQMGCTCYSYAQKLARISSNDRYVSMANNMNEILRDAYIQL